MNQLELQKLALDQWVAFDAHRFKSAKTLWVDEEAYAQDAELRALVQAPYGIKGAPCFESLDFDEGPPVSLVAERYGGEGIAANGGGGRCGNAGSYQLKGIGPNSMVGDHSEAVHAYGGLDAPLAIIETIYTNLLAVLLPHGAVRIRGLVHVGDDTAFFHHPANKCWGVVMIRDACFRPAHLMRAPYFEPQPRYRGSLRGDVARLRILNKRLATHFRHPSQYVSFLSRFLQRCASQFAFARAARLMHGALTPSNITMEGQWLDLPMTSALNGGVNHCLTSQFYSEHQIPLTCAIELLHNFGKYNGISLDASPLISFYSREFDTCFNRYIGYVLGFPSSCIGIESASWRQLVDAFGRLIHANPALVNDGIRFDEKDPVHSLIVALFLSLKNQKAAQHRFDAAGFSRDDAVGLAQAFKQVVDVVWGRISDSRCAPASYHGFVKLSALKAIKRAYLASAFYGPAVSDQVWELCQHGRPADVAPAINDYQELGICAFSEDAGRKTVLINTPNVTLSFNHDTFELVENGETLLCSEFPCIADRLRCGMDGCRFREHYLRFVDVLEQLMPLLDGERCQGVQSAR
jgi:hypothetical protein